MNMGLSATVTFNATTLAFNSSPIKSPSVIPNLSESEFSSLCCAGSPTLSSFADVLSDKPPLSLSIT